MDGADSVLELAERFAAAIVAADFPTMRSLMTPDCRVSHNYRQTEVESISGEEAISSIRRMRSAVKEFAYRDVRRIITQDGFLQMHQVRCVTNAGTMFHVDVALIATVTERRISSYREYLDSSHIAPLRRELAGAGAAK